MAKTRPSRRKAIANAPQFVLDCSLVFAWYFADEADPYADAVARSLSSSSLVVVPSHWPLEVANTLVVGERRKRSTEAQAAAFLARLTALPIVIDEQTAKHAWLATCGLARNHCLSAYDAAYLELAMRLRVPIATLDRSLQAAAQALGIGAYQPQALKS